MARIPEEELERIKRSTDLVALVRASGVELKPQGRDLVGRCVFHGPDETPSLVITPDKQLYHCFACDAGGDVIEWVRRTQGLSFPHAVEVLREALRCHGGAAVLALPAPRSRPTSGLPPKESSVRRLPPPVDFDAEDHELLLQVVEYYHSTLAASPEALAYLAKRGIDKAGVVDACKLGYANRTLGLRLPTKQRADGRTIRERLTTLGIIRASGREHLNGCLVVPVFDGDGHVAELYGRKIQHQAVGRACHLYLPGPRRGVFNLSAFASKEIILCEALIDALTFLCAGFPNVTSSYGVNGFTAEHLAVMKAHGAERVLIAYDHDEAGDTAAAALSMSLAAEGIASFRIRFPHGMDANEYACKMHPPEQALAVLVRSAEYMAGQLPVARAPLPAPTRPPAVALAPAPPASVPRPIRPVTPAIASPAVPAPALSLAAAAPPADDAEAIDISDMVEAVDDQNHAAADVALPAAPPPPPAITTPPPPMATTPAAPLLSSPVASDQPPATIPASPVAPPLRLEIPAEVSDHQVVLHLADRTWRVRGLGKNLSFESMRVNLFVGLDGHPERFHQDTLDLYSAKQRQAFVRIAAGELGSREDLVKKDVGAVLLKLEELQEQAIRQALEAKPKAPNVSEAEAAAALELLRDPRLLERILEDFERCGVVGEETNKLVGYLAAVSRKLEQPLAVMVQSSSAAGKSALMNAVLAFVPDEERVAYSAMTGQSLFYMGEADLAHKILAIAEEEGAQRAAYALKLLQSEGELTIASTGKDPATGRLVTHEYRVEGPAAIFMTTTAIDLDEELLNRCLVLTVNEDREQTRAIHRMQRESQTIEGIVARRRRARLLALHRNAQRLLKPFPIFNPFARELTFLDDATRTRRDHLKYLGLIAAITLLRQYQREHRFVACDGEGIEHLVVSLDDIATANQLAAEVLGHTLDELPPQTRRFLLFLDAMVAQACQEKAIPRSELRFSRADARHFTGWSYPQVRTHLDRLVEMEYVLVHRGGRGQSFVYELLYAGQGQDGEPFLMGLLDAETLRTKAAATAATLTPAEPALSGPAPGVDPSLTPHCSPVDPPVLPSDDGQELNHEAPSHDQDAESGESALLRTPSASAATTLDRSGSSEPATEEEGEDEEPFSLAAIGSRSRSRP